MMACATTFEVALMAAPFKVALTIGGRDMT
jgi:hypothetical protein